MNLALDQTVKVRLPGTRFAWALYEGVTITPADNALAQQLSDEQQRIKETFSIESIAQDEGVAASRRAFKALGLDPARYRPSQEALLRRVLKDQPVTLINNGVDVCNLLSIRYRVPMGCYDADQIAAEAAVKVGTAADVYAALNGRDVECADKLILCDRQGPIGSPYVDSQRTAVGTGCRRCLHVVYFCPVTLSPDSFHDMIKTISASTGGQTEGYRFITA